jgi:hypothetical protein
MPVTKDGELKGTKKQVFFLILIVCPLYSTSQMIYLNAY